MNVFHDSVYVDTQIVVIGCFSIQCSIPLDVQWPQPQGPTLERRIFQKASGCAHCMSSLAAAAVVAWGIHSPFFVADFLVHPQP